MKDKNTVIEVIGKKVWFKNAEAIWSYDLVDLFGSSKRKKTTVAASPEKIISNMPGKVTKIFINKGETVKIGQPLLVLEAMKMEYTLKSDLNTQVEDIKVEIGHQVTLGQLLIQLKKV